MKTNSAFVIFAAAAEKAYPKLIHFNRLDKGGHFAAWEQPSCSLAKCAPRSNRCASQEVATNERHDRD
jgi:hypothetical protein